MQGPRPGLVRRYLRALRSRPGAVCPACRKRIGILDETRIYRGKEHHTRCLVYHSEP